MPNSANIFGSRRADGDVLLDDGDLGFSRVDGAWTRGIAFFAEELHDFSEIPNSEAIALLQEARLAIKDNE